MAGFVQDFRITRGCARYGQPKAGVLSRTMSDLRNILDTLAALALVEVLVKPITIRLGRLLLRRVDDRIHWIPDWLYSRQQDE